MPLGGCFRELGLVAAFASHPRIDGVLRRCAEQRAHDVAGESTHDAYRREDRSAAHLPCRRDLRFVGAEQEEANGPQKNRRHRRRSPREHRKREHRDDGSGERREPHHGRGTQARGAVDRSELVFFGHHYGDPYVSVRANRLDDAFEQRPLETFPCVESSDLLTLDVRCGFHMSILAGSFRAKELPTRNRRRVRNGSHRNRFGDAGRQPRGQRHPRIRARRGDAEHDSQGVYEPVLSAKDEVREPSATYVWICKVVMRPLLRQAEHDKLVARSVPPSSVAGPPREDGCRGHRKSATGSTPKLTQDSRPDADSALCNRCLSPAPIVLDVLAVLCNAAAARALRQLGRHVAARPSVDSRPACGLQLLRAARADVDAMTTSPLPLVYGKRLDDLDVLARCPLLRGLHIKEISTFLDLLDQIALPAGTCVFREGDEGDFMYFVLEGEARLKRSQLELRTVGPGDHFGELAMLASRPRPATVEAHTTMRLARLSRARYLSLSTNHPRIALHFTQALASSLGDQLTAMTDSVGLLAYQRTLPRATQVRVRRGADELVVGTGTLAGTLLPRELDGSLVVGSAIDKKPATLESALVSDAAIEPLTLASSEGRAIYGRSAALVLLEAARRALPELDVRMGAPLENGHVIQLKAGGDRAELASKLLTAMQRLAREDAPLREEVWATDEARAILGERGSADAAALLLNRRESTVTLATCGETFAVDMGPLLPRAGWLSGFSIEPHPEGLLLRLHELDRFMPVLHGTRVDPVAFEAVTPRYGSPMTATARQWLDGIGVRSVGGFDELCVTGRVAELIRIAEGFHEKWIGRIADTVAERRDAVKVIVIAGPSSSGKTTFIKRLTVQLLVNGMRPINVSLDDYYVDREKTVRDDEGNYDFEAFEALDAALLRAHVGRLLAGDTVVTARFDFPSGRSLPSGGHELAMKQGDVLLLEGIHGLNPALLEGLCAENAFRIFVHPATSLPFDRLNVLASEDVRLLRRLVRDRHQRNYSAADTILRWPSVRRGELCHIFPYLPHANVVFDSSLVYEMSVLKTYAERYLLEVPPGHPAFTAAHRLRRLIDQFVAIYPDHVPPTSVIREFIGGSGFEY